MAQVIRAPNFPPPLQEELPLPELKNPTTPEVPIFGPTETTFADLAINEEDELNFSDGVDDTLGLVRSLVPIIYVVTHEENRFISSLVKAVHVGKKIKPRNIWTWSTLTGLTKGYNPENIVIASGPEKETQEPAKMLQKIIDAQILGPKGVGDIYILKDFHKMLNNHIPRILRDMYSHLKTHKKTIIIVAPMLAHGAGGNTRGIEPTLDKQMTVVNFKLPSAKSIELLVKRTVAATKTHAEAFKVKTEYTEDQYREATRALQGLTYQEAEQAIRTSIAQKKELNIDWLLTQKRNIIKKGDILEYIEPTVLESDLGGMDEAKKFFRRYKNANTAEAKKYGLKPLRGVLLTGVPGTGKSSLAKAVSALWHLPLLRLDVGKVMGGLVGQSESQMRQAIATAEAIAPCILYLDEIEKALSGTGSSNFSDGGTLSRVFGFLLTWMAEGNDGVTIVATANDISKLPPELIRRFNESFFVDLPSEMERLDIFSIHISKVGRNVKEFDMKQLIKHSRNFTGAEIEKAVSDMISMGWDEGARDVGTADLVTALKSTKPIAQVMPEKIDALREWARTRARYASSEAIRLNAPGKQVVETTSGEVLDVESAMDFGDLEDKKV